MFEFVTVASSECAVLLNQISPKVWCYIYGQGQKLPFVFATFESKIRYIGWQNKF